MYFKYVVCFFFLELNCSLSVSKAVFKRISSYHFCQSYCREITETVLRQHGYEKFYQHEREDRIVWHINKGIRNFSTGAGHVLGILNNNRIFKTWKLACSDAGWYLKVYYHPYIETSSLLMLPHQVDSIIRKYKYGIK